MARLSFQIATVRTRLQIGNLLLMLSMLDLFQWWHHRLWFCDAIRSFILLHVSLSCRRRRLQRGNCRDNHTPCYHHCGSRSDRPGRIQASNIVSRQGINIRCQSSFWYYVKFKYKILVGFNWSEAWRFLRNVSSDSITINETILNIIFIHMTSPKNSSMIYLSRNYDAVY